MDISVDRYLSFESLRANSQFANGSSSTGPKSFGGFLEVFTVEAVTVTNSIFAIRE
jgi:hypothetical protein